MTVDQKAHPMEQRPRPDWEPDLRVIVARLEGVPEAELSPEGAARAHQLAEQLNADISELAHELVGVENEERIEEIFITLVERVRRGLLE